MGGDQGGATRTAAGVPAGGLATGIAMSAEPTTLPVGTGAISVGLQGVPDPGVEADTAVEGDTAVEVDMVEAAAVTGTL